ncbi:kanadaptin [Prunus yedoensis var. nudiflora]|uniref:Kanadaptin n=1 Tax=Prunus yedoensis var. nudiflora TaxID=2094558 RepID=A0A314US59_PRUYE|nr:kanadaptin [Prunus yedoensis var. nudiflora]
MTTAMAPPPDPVPETLSSEPAETSSSAITMKPPMEAAEDNARQTLKPQSQGFAVPYTIPPWSAAPCHQFQLEVLKDGAIINQFDVYEKGAYMFGRIDLCDFVLEHPTVSRFHAVLQFKRSGEAYLYDLGSTHGTFINKNQVNKKVYVDLCVGDVIRFGHSSRLYIFQGPSELMPPEKDPKLLRVAKMHEDILDQEASLQRARLEASLADGISWGMEEDAIEEAEDDGEEVTWQTYKGQLTEKQEKTREKVLKRLEKIAHMKKEIDAIRAKDISQGGLSQGQQTQIARNEQRIAQIMEELENLEETLNESIRESLGARVGKLSYGKKKGPNDEEEELLSDDDEFYDRTKKPSSKKAGENPSVETSDTLLDKRDAIMKEMEEKKELLSIEKSKMASKTTDETDAADALDAYMSGLSSQLVLNKTEELQKELSALQSELDRIIFLLKIADPSGEAAKKRDSKLQEMQESKPNKSETPAPAIKKQPPMEPKESSQPGKPANDSLLKDGNYREGKNVVYTVVKPQWLGAVEDKRMEKGHQEAAPSNEDEAGEFVDYKDRKKILENVSDAKVNMESGIENAAPGLIIRKRKQVHESKENDSDSRQQPASSTGAEFMAEDAVALLLKHKRGYYAPDDETQDVKEGKQLSKDKKKPKRVLGPEKPSFLDTNSDETWVPPEGQSGDGRTSLNSRYGY